MSSARTLKRRLFSTRWTGRAMMCDGDNKSAAECTMKNPIARIVVEIGDKNNNGKLDVTVQGNVTRVPLVGEFNSPEVTVDVPSAEEALSMLGPQGRAFGSMIDSIAKATLKG